jgi:NADP-dependent 3-hydroxy acid dehydrogenase YdfG
MSGITGKVVAITGAGSGIGKATALRLAEGGAKVVLGGRREDRLAKLADRIVAVGGDAAWTQADVRQWKEVAALVALARERYGQLDVFVANAGIGPVSPLDDLRVDDWEAMVDINVKGVLYGIAAALPVFREQGFGHFVHTLSTAGLTVAPGMAVYAGTKNAARTISEGLRQEAGPTVRVTTVSPGFVDTAFVEMTPDGPARTELIAHRNTIAIPPDAIARAIAFAIEQPAEVDVNEIVVRPTAQA